MRSLLTSFRIHIMHILCMVWITVHGQNVINFDVDDGLPSNVVYRVSQDASGFIWILTDKGIARFNGSEFKVFTTAEGLPTNDVWDMKITPDGKLWYFSKSASLGYIEKDKVYSFKGCEDEEAYYPASLLRFGNTMIFRSHNAWYTLKNNCWENLKSPEQVRNNSTLEAYLEEFTADQRPGLDSFYDYYDKITNQEDDSFVNLNQRVDDSLSFWLYKGGYAIENLETGKIVHKKFLNRHSEKYPEFTRCIFINDGMQLTGFNFVSKLDNAYELEEEAVIPEDFAAQFSIIDSRGNLWCASMYNGLYFIPEAQRKAKYLLEGERIKQLEKLGEEYFAWTTDQGYYLFDPLKEEFKLKFELKGLTQDASFIEELSRYYFFADQQAIITDENLNVIKRLENPGMRKLVYHDHNLFAISSSGIKRVDPESLQLLELYPLVGVNCMVDTGNQLLLGTSSGLMELTDEGVNTHRTSGFQNELPVLSISELTTNQFLVGTDGFGLYHVKGDSATLVPGTEGLSIEDISVSENGAWLATGSGALEIRYEDGALKKVRKLTRNTGLPSTNVKGLEIIGKQLLIATAGAVSLLNPEDIRIPELQHLYVDKLLYNKRELENGSSLSYANNATLELKIAAVSYLANPQPLQYRYRLTPGDEAWRDGSSSTLNFGRLKPDEYTLRIASGDLETTYEFTIEPLWWQRGTIKTLFVIIIVLLIIFALQRYRKYELKKKMSKLELQNKLTDFELYALRSQMNPHFVFNSLAAIQFCINNNQVELAEKYLVKFSRLVRQFFDMSKQKEADLESEIKLLRNYLDIEKLRFKEKLDYSVRISPELERNNPKIPTMLLQPIVENAINHGIFNRREGGRVDIEFRGINDNTIRVDIADNGVGMKATTKPLNGKRTSSDVLNERIKFLNKGGEWKISYKNKAAFPEQEHPGNVTTFTIQSRS